MTNTNPQATLYAALAKAQSEMKNAPLNRVNPHFKSKYADLAAIRDAVIPALTKNGIAVFQGPEIIIQSHTPICADISKPQAYAAALTYARRMGLSSAACISADEDDDGNAAQAQAEAAPKTISEKQHDELVDLIVKKGLSREPLLKYYAISDLSELPASRFAHAKSNLESKPDVPATAMEQD